MTANPHRLSLDRTVARFLESVEGRITTTNRDVRLAGRFAGLGVDEQVSIVDAGEFGSIRTCIVRPAGSTAALPTVVYLHGGGWTAEGLYSHERLIAGLALGSGVAVVVPEYCVVMPACHPAAVEQAYATARWVASDGPRWRLDPSRIAVVGDSSGGNAAIGAVLLSLRRREFRISQLVALTPITDTACDAGSCLLFAEGYFLRREDLRVRRAQYLPRGQHADPTVAPLRADRSELARFPASLIITAEADVVRDQGEAFAARLREAGAATTAVRYEGTVHGFAVLDALRDTSASRAALAQAVHALRNSLGAGPRTPL
ncbi:alpha/beta hydrolase [Mycolicibacterium arseniciresistens]|uniref:Alpha/beta hydrolase n=1 Tax=Mycolicibacterium arseniciresistens TaxID=3062257 RepID=A0ABT8UFA1_9MYCO|nr:alpha/beta hydrolase [Mycolicibacterium arseniciresistens]MDO3635560.1 alpha/beta hydrolase [Mycolicibacterium arseniciresistens]